MTHPIEAINAGKYTICFNEDGYRTLNCHLRDNNYSKIFIVTDSYSNANCTDRLLPMLETESIIEIIEFEAGEQNKTIETCVEIWTVLTELRADRKSLIINLGGGVVSDLGGFVAATFKRGIRFINIPTTLLAMVDASVGGKNGVDLAHLKNQIGTITDPAMVVVDTEFLQTLPQNEMRSGLAEMLKHGLVYDKAHWGRFIDMSKTDAADFDFLIRESIVIKNEIVMQDRTEDGIRKALNFGHTLGHAIETCRLSNQSAPTMLHGEAVAVGMILEAYVSMRKSWLSKAEYMQIKTVIKNIFDDVSFTSDEINTIIELLMHDKKNEYGVIQFTLLQEIGKIIINQEVDNELIFNAFEDYKR